VGLVTRGVLVDVAALRGSEWVSAEHPVTADDIAAALDLTGVRFCPGDALMVYMGRDKFEAARQPYYEHFFEEKRPGIGRSGAEWIAEHDVGMLAWDFSDANHPDEPLLSTHQLLWAIGLVLVDNCDFSTAIGPMRAAGRATGAFSVAPLPLVGATGCNVNPLLVL
jgi:kynurenine formamidase